MAKNYKRAQAVISLKNARYNFLEVKSKLKPSTKICCVVKADAYGHGAVKLSKLYQSLGAHFFATATFEEAVTLRNNGITKPILILGYTSPTLSKLIESYNLSQTVHSKEYAEVLLRVCKKQNAKIKIHLKIDTGLNRIGFVCQNKETSNLNDAVKLLLNDNFILEGIYTHFACSDDYKKGKSYTYKQQSNFLFAIKYLKSKGLNFQIKHAGNSAVVYNYPKFCLDMVRVGIVLYGISPSKLLKEKPKLKKVLTLKTIIESVKTVKKGCSVGYGLECITKKDIKVATLPVGYADGILRSIYKSDYRVLVNGVKCPFIGRVNMDKCTIDVTGVNAKVFDEVLIFGNDKNSNIENFAKNCKTIPYEVACLISNRVEKYYD